MVNWAVLRFSGDNLNERSGADQGRSGHQTVAVGVVHRELHGNERGSRSMSGLRSSWWMRIALLAILVIGACAPQTGAPPPAGQPQQSAPAAQQPVRIG